MFRADGSATRQLVDAVTGYSCLVAKGRLIQRQPITRRYAVMESNPLLAERRVRERGHHAIGGCRSGTGKWVPALPSVPQPNSIVSDSDMGTLELLAAKSCDEHLEW
jgi:hypothetical protein